MRLIDLTHVPSQDFNSASVVAPSQRVIGFTSGEYTANLYDFHHDGMYGTYLDLPGHIEETHDGLDAATVPIQTHYRMRAMLVRPDLLGQAGAVTADQLTEACPHMNVPEAVVIHALGARRFDEIEPRSVYLAHDALDWIESTGCRVLVSDIYESKKFHGVFPRLFSAGISTVCHPVLLHEIDTPHFLLTIMFIPYPGATQLPCRIVAELDEPRSD